MPPQVRNPQSEYTRKRGWRIIEEKPRFIAGELVIFLSTLSLFLSLPFSLSLFLPPSFSQIPSPYNRRRVRSKFPGDRREDIICSSKDLWMARIEARKCKFCRAVCKEQRSAHEIDIKHQLHEPLSQSLKRTIQDLQRKRRFRQESLPSREHQ